MLQPWDHSGYAPERDKSTGRRGAGHCNSELDLRTNQKEGNRKGLSQCTRKIKDKIKKTLNLAFFGYTFTSNCNFTTCWFPVMEVITGPCVTRNTGRIVAITLHVTLANVPIIQFPILHLWVPPCGPQPTCSRPQAAALASIPPPSSAQPLSGWRRALRESIFPSVFSPIHPSIPFQPLLSRCTQGAAVNRVHPRLSRRVKEGLRGGQVASLLRRRYTEADKQPPAPAAHGKWAAPNQPNAHVFARGVETKGWRWGGMSEPRPQPWPSRWLRVGGAAASPRDCVGEPHGEPSQGRSRQ